MSLGSAWCSRRSPRRPLWLRRYRDEGQATDTAVPFEGHVALSAVDGMILSAKHPPAWRSVVGRMKKLFTRG